MAEDKTYNLSDLLLDTENPRIDEQASQRAAIEELVKDQGRKLLKLAEHMAVNGFHPAERPMVVPVEDGTERAVVVEGNRRILAAKCLVNPDLLEGVATNHFIKTMKGHAGVADATQLERVRCTVFDNREDADPWIELKHTGENGGVGVVKWGAPEVGRFSERRGKKRPDLQALDFVAEHADLPEDVLEKVQDRKLAITNLQRLLNDGYVRERLGIEKVDGRLTTTLPDDEVAKGLGRIVRDLVEKKIKVTDIEHKPDRAKYVDTIISGGAGPDLSKSEGASRDLTSSSGEKATKSGKPSGGAKKNDGSKSSGKRKKLVPAGFSMHCDDRLADLLRELRRLPLRDYPNAVGVLFRVFLELSIDAFIDAKGIAFPTNPSLSWKLNTAAQSLEDDGVMSKNELKPVRAAAQKGSLMPAAVTTMHDFVHNRHHRPDPDSLRTQWDNLSAFLTKMADAVQEAE